ncbi:hypothetical protein [Leisingera methylohalidivorans]|uniref:Uncharacterized protein n=1 Tax=Leisingera methylohalidivorans DSM 14336 TaxID=999552 RepID=V9VY66_9RHOB|nr:hypothetical protein [Leisingera methylohalidivorans]AHD03671.1 hypothetical protein METH_22845 [Leisingera methylohalidivorans DSM 14336]
MIVARWSLDVRFGHKDAALALMRKWWDEIAPQIDWTPDQARIVVGSVGAAESAVVVEITLNDLGALHTAWTRLAEATGQAEWASDLEPHIVSGSPRWEVFRVIA